MVNEKILIVEDEEKIAALLFDYLEESGYKASIINQGDMVIPHVKKDPPAMILLDIMLPGMDGMDICKEVRKFSNIPIIMITARIEEVDRLIGLGLGADDYICKPFSPREMVARVKAVLRRVHTDPNKSSLTVGSIILDEDKHQVTIKDSLLKLTPCEFGLLKVMMTHPDRVFSRNDLLNRVQGYAFEGYDRTIDSHIKNLRKKISTKLPDQDIIVSVYGVGYKLNTSQA